MSLFSNHYRFLKIIFLILVVLGLGFYSYKAGPETQLSYQDCLQESEKYRSQEIAVLYAPIVSQNEESLILKDCRGVILVEGVKEEIDSKYISVKGEFQDSFIMASEIKTHSQRYLKYLVSLISVILVGFTFFKQFSFDFQKKVFRKRKS